MIPQASPDVFQQLHTDEQVISDQSAVFPNFKHGVIVHMHDIAQTAQLRQRLNLAHCLLICRAAQMLRRIQQIFIVRQNFNGFECRRIRHAEQILIFHAVHSAIASAPYFTAQIPAAEKRFILMQSLLQSQHDAFPLSCFYSVKIIPKLSDGVNHRTRQRIPRTLCPVYCGIQYLIFPHSNVAVLPF